MSAAGTTALACWARCTTPLRVWSARAGTLPPVRRRIVYLNVNCAYEFWQDVKIAPLHWFDTKPAWQYLPFLIGVGNLVLNSGPFVLLRVLSAMLETSPPS